MWEYTPSAASCPALWHKCARHGATHINNVRARGLDAKDLVLRIRGLVGFKMSKAYSTYLDNVDSAYQLHRIASEQSASGMEYDVSELYRSELILIVSAFDTYFHDILADIQTKRILKGKTWKKYMRCRYGFSPQVVRSLKSEANKDIRKQRIRKALLNCLHRYTFQKSKAISNGFAHCKIYDIWRLVSLGWEDSSEADIINKLDAIIKERNLIAHQAHIDSETNEKRLISGEDVDKAKEFLTEIVLRVDAIVEERYL